MKAMEENWTKIFNASQLHLVEIYHGILNENSIESVIVNKQDSAYLFGEIELYVRSDDAFEAIQIIKKNQIQSNSSEESTDEI
jgi:hypothetical protein